MFMCCSKESSVINSIYSGQQVFSYTKMKGIDSEGIYYDRKKI
jgi:hypothetical protein